MKPITVVLLTLGTLGGLYLMQRAKAQPVSSPAPSTVAELTPAQQSQLKIVGVMQGVPQGTPS